MINSNIIPTQVLFGDENIAHFHPGFELPNNLVPESTYIFASDYDTDIEHLSSLKLKNFGPNQVKFWPAGKINNTFFKLLGRIRMRITY